MFGCFRVSRVKYEHISELTLANQTIFLSSTYYFTYSSVYITIMEPEKEKNPTRSNIMANLNARMTALEVRMEIEQVCAPWHA